MGIVTFALCNQSWFVSLTPYGEISGDLSGMFYAVSAVYGVIAGFTITALTIIAATDSESVKSLRANAQFSIPVKLLWAVLTLITYSLINALIGPMSNKEIAITLLVVSVITVLFELLATSFLVLLSTTPWGRHGSV
jgi:hypothetical protein